MPIVSVQLIEGYDGEAKERLGRAVTNAVLSVVDASPDVVIVITHDVPSAGYMRGGVRRPPGAPRPDPKQLVQVYLAAMEARDLDGARAMLAPGFAMTFPGGVRMRTPDELVAWARPRYRFVRKTSERFDVVQDGADAVVYCFGTLSGEWPDGGTFSGIRFIDRFVVRGGLIVLQDVWNDIAEMKAGAGA